MRPHNFTPASPSAINLASMSLTLCLAQACRASFDAFSMGSILSAHP